MREVPSWNLNCISDKPTLTHPGQQDNTILYILSRDQFSLCHNEEGCGGG